MASNTGSTMRGETIRTGIDERNWTFVVWGIGLWALAAVLVRVAGQFLLVPNAPLVLVAVYLVTVPAMAGIALGPYQLYGITRSDRPRTAVLLVLPAAVLDAVALLLYGTLFPNLAAGTAPLFAVWVLVAYVGVFVTTLGR
jgi:hypothetical protein